MMLTRILRYLGVLGRGLLPVIAVAVYIALPASTASAVVVENPGMHEIEGENTVAIVGDHSELGAIDLVRCNGNLEADISSDGHVDVHDIELSQHAGSTANCATINDCDDAGWEGQIEEDYFNEIEQTEHEFGVDMTFCLENAPPLPSVPIPVQCEINNDEAHCHTIVGAIPVGEHLVPVEIVGEVFFHDPLGLMHDEA